MKEVIKYEKSYKNYQLKRKGINIKMKKYICMYCDREYTTSKGLGVHMRRLTDCRPTKVKCSWCGKALANNITLQNHMFKTCRKVPDEHKAEYRAYRATIKGYDIEL